MSPWSVRQVVLLNALARRVPRRQAKVLATEAEKLHRDETELISIVLSHPLQWRGQMHRAGSILKVRRSEALAIHSIPEVNPDGRASALPRGMGGIKGADQRPLPVFATPRRFAR